MPKDRACANTPALSRRMFLAASPFAAVATGPSDETEILSLFRRHRVLRDAAEICSDKDGPFLDCLVDQVEDEMMALPCGCAADLAAKMIVAHCDGAFSCLPWDDPVWIEARRLTGQA
ncbi:hypothetical protein LZ190_09725 [Rhodovulum sulfidophilum]|nr:hypothetical protein [Rhodovulum sulfidophilum]